MVRLPDSDRAGRFDRIAPWRMAQTPVAAPDRPVADLAGSTEPNPLPGLPRPPDQPASLLQAGPCGSGVWVP